jgi:hypothetical protein
VFLVISNPDDGQSPKTQSLEPYNIYSISYFSDFDPDYPTGGITITGLERDYCISLRHREKRDLILNKLHESSRSKHRISLPTNLPIQNMVYRP